MFVHLFKLFTGSNIFLRFRSLDLYIYIYNFEISNSFQLIPQNLKKPNQLLTPPRQDGHVPIPDLLPSNSRATLEMIEAKR